MKRFEDAFYSLLRCFGSSRWVAQAYEAICRLSLSYLILRLRKISQVQLVYLRRGMGKNECIPFLSDIDVTVVTSDEAGTEKVRAAVSSLKRIIPMLEEQVFAMTQACLASALEAPSFLKIPK